MSNLGLKYDSGGIDRHWTADEQTLMEQLIHRYNSLSHSILNFYAHIASQFTHKTIRDVALRHKWMIDKQSTSSIPATTANTEGEIKFNKGDDNGDILITYVKAEAREVLTRNSQMFDKILDNRNNHQLDGNDCYLSAIYHNIRSLLHKNLCVIPEKAKQMLLVADIDEAHFDSTLSLLRTAIAIKQLRQSS